MKKLFKQGVGIRTELSREPPLWLPSEEAVSFVVMRYVPIICYIRKSTLETLMGIYLEKPRHAMNAYFSLKLRFLSAVDAFLDANSESLEEPLEVTPAMLGLEPAAKSDGDVRKCSGAGRLLQSVRTLL